MKLDALDLSRRPGAPQSKPPKRSASPSSSNRNSGTMMPSGILPRTRRAGVGSRVSGVGDREWAADFGFWIFDLRFAILNLRFGIPGPRAAPQKDSRS